MLGLLSRVFRQALTERDNATYCVLRLVIALGVLVFLALAVANWRHFDPQAFGLGFGAVAGAGGAGLGFKASTESPPA